MRSTRLLANTAEVWIGLSVGYLLSLLGAAAVAKCGVGAAGAGGAAGAASPTDAAGSGPAGPEPDQPSRPFVVTLVPAHDEELCIADAVAALARQNYPKTRHETIVIADNCTDATAERAAEAGATVWERTDTEARGKGHALRWALERVWRQRPDAAVVTFVDADCLASENFLEGVVAALAGGEAAAQVRYLVSNIDAGVETALRAASFYLTDGVHHSGRSALGLSCGLRGTGMAFSSQLLQEVPWDSHSVTEDREFHLKLLQAGHVVRFVEEASVSSPMPTTPRVARSQQLRWESGNAALIRGEVPRLLREAVERRDVQLAHGALERYVPPQSVLAALAILLGLRRGRWGRLARRICVGELAYVLGGLAVADAPPAVWEALPHAPGLVLRRLRLVGESLLPGAATDWVRTEREKVATDA